MNAFFYYSYNFLRSIFENVYNVFIAVRDCIVGLLDIKYYIELFNTYYPEMSPLGWIAAIIMHILLLVLFVLIIYLILKGLKVLFRFKVPVVKYEQMKDEVVKLKREIMKANYEKDKILAMKISEMDMELNPELLESRLQKIDEESANEAGIEVAEPNADIAASADVADAGAGLGVVAVGGEISGDEEEKIETVDTSEPRFPRLSLVDRLYASPEYQPPVYDNNITLEEVCVQFRNFAASRLGLYYDLEIMKQVIATFGAAKMLILQGISGTGKTSLPYAFGQFIQNPSLICSVQPSWRDRTELFGYYNDFTKKYTETEFLKTLYEAHYYEDMRVVILDEMNIARVEYYFAEMLSLLEMPREDERYFSVVSSEAGNDPIKMKEGKVWIPSNVWYVGTINNDDSTFAVSDKVYDRAIPIDLDDKAEPFEAPDTPPMRISYNHMSKLYEEAKANHPISEEMILELEKLDRYLIDHFRITFGNRILRQIKAFVPCYVGCGGTELDGVDFMFAKKILRKFESLGIGFIRDELDGLILYLDTTFGKENFKISKAYLLRLKRMSGASTE
ncbi:MAG: hypothetical protein K2M73_09670 [Lachnospiraceae bacterium]|nr:hypothetical protein [Lachnospiraceae bacterium]